MPSRHLLPSPPPPHIHGNTHRFVPLLAGGIAAAALLLLILSICIRRISRKRAVLSPSCAVESKPPHRFSYGALRRATANFDPSLRLGQGGFGSVYRGSLRVSGFRPDVPVAVKVMDSGSLQGEREFQNELFFAGKLDSDRVVPIIGFFSEQRFRRMVLVYDLMPNGSLQDCLLHRKCSELKIWKIRFSIALDIAKGLEYLHHSCDPSVIHGDIKPSNILLDSNFNAKIGDFGLARLKPQDHLEIEVKKEGILGNVADDIDETESVTTITNGCEDLPPEAPVVSPRTLAATASPSEGSFGNFDGLSVDSGRETSDKKGRVKKEVSRNDWWWKQDSGRVESGGPVKDYVMEWIGSEIQKERPGSSELVDMPSSHTEEETKKKKKKKKHRKRLDWWISMDEDGDKKGAKAGKRRPAREWWKEEYCEELQRKKKKMMKKQGGQSCNPAGGVDLQSSRRRNSMDWWLDGISGELWKARRNSCDSAASGEIPKGGCISSTPSMRGTVCYAAPEYGICGDHLSEKCDVYSYGVLLLVLITGRRPLQVTGSPMSEFRRANLLSWARHLARAGKLPDLVDPSMDEGSLDREEALMCIKLALLCVQKSPARRPSMKEVVGVLSGELVLPELPAELSPSRAAARLSLKKVR